MVSAIISRVVILVFGTLYPAYASYKAVKTKNVKEYVKWMMYWIVFAFFTCAETFSDIFLAWLPFYYELKILFVIWLLSPATKGSSILYRKFVHPQLAKREKEIDQYINRASDQGYSAILSLGSKGFNYATNVVLATAIKGQSKIVDQLRKSYSMNDLSPDGLSQPRRTSTSQDSDDELDNRILEERYRSEMDLRVREEIPEENEEDLPDLGYKEQDEEYTDDHDRPDKNKKNRRAQKEHYATLPKAKTRSSKRTSAKEVFA